MGRMTTPRRLRLPTVLLTHPFELALGLVLVLILIRGLLVDQVTPSVDSTLPFWPRAAYQAASGGAGVCIVFGLLVREKWRPGKGVEQFGLWLAAGALLSYAYILGASVGWSGFVNITMSALIGIACILRNVGLRVAELLKLSILVHSNEENDDA